MSNDPRPTPRIAREVFRTPVHEEIRDSFLAYSLSVITSRAIPDVRDGLKPVQRRILYGMYERGLRPDRPQTKSAQVVGTVMGTYHPHGDSAIYDALVRMTQDFAMRVPLVDGHGNFGSLDDPPAAMRYCLRAQTLLRMADGSTRRIADLVQAAPNSSVSIDLKVLGQDGVPVLATKLFHSGSHPTQRLRTHEGFELTGTENHPVLCLTEVDGAPRVQWKLLGSIEPGDRVVISRSINQNSGDASEEAKMLAFLAGAMISEGWATERSAGFGNVDPDFFDAVLHAYDQLVGGNRRTRVETLTSGRPLHRFDTANLSSFAASPLSELLGWRSGDKRIPTFVWLGGTEIKRAFLQSLFEGDGCASYLGRNTVQISYATYSDELARDVQELLLEFGIVSRQARYANGETKLVIGNRRDARLFAQRVGFWGAKQEKLTHILAALPVGSSSNDTDRIPFLARYVRGAEGLYGHKEWLSKHSFDRTHDWETRRDELLAHIPSSEVRKVIESVVDHGWYFATVASVTDAGVQPVYTVKVDSDDHSFLAGGFVNHNTECRMASAATEMLADIDEDTVDFRDNYDGKHQEPEVLPARLPNLLVNGTSGIAVGMATNLAPHNPGEVIAAALHLLEHPDATLDDLMAFVPSPDFPTGGVIVDAGGIREAYATGRGSFRLRAKATVGDVSARRRGITITELPYNVGAERFIGRVKDLVNAKVLDGISDIKDLSDRKKGLNIVVECKTGVNPTGLLAELYAKTPLEETFAINAVVLVDGRPLTLGLADLLRHYLDHRLEVVVRRTRHRLARAQERAHIVEGLVLALASIDEVVAVIRRSKGTEEARDRLIKAFTLSEIQASHILEMPLRRLTSLEVAKLKDELKQLKATIKDLEAILASPTRQRALVADELREVGDTFASPRRSRVLAADKADLGAVSLDLPDDPCTVTLSVSGVVGRQAGAFKGKATTHDVLAAQVATTTRSSVGAVTDRGRLVTVEAGEVPEVAGRNRGAAAAEVFDLERGERVVAVLALPAAVPWCLVSRQGVVKRLAPDQLATKPGTALIALRDGDAVVGAVEAPDGADVILVASDAQVLRTGAATVRPQGRSAGGVAGMRLGEGATVIAVGVVAPDGDGVRVLTVSDGGAAKSSPASEFPAKGRGTGGVRAMRLRKSETRLVAAAVGAGAFAVSGGGSVSVLEPGTAKRDAPGDALEHAVDEGAAGMARA